MNFTYSEVEQLRTMAQDAPYGLKRTIPFCKTETALLVELVSERKEVIESRAADGITNKLKAEIWSDIEDKFNYKDLGVLRSSHQLKLKYVDLKRQLRKKVADYKYRMAKGTSDNTLALTEDEHVIYPWIYPSARSQNVSTESEPITFEVVEEVFPSTVSISDDYSSNQSVTSDHDEPEITFEDPKIEPVDCNESYTENLYEENEQPSMKRKKSNGEEAKILELYKKKEAIEDKEHKLLVQNYEMEISLLKKKLKEFDESNGSATSYYEREMLAYYKRKELKEDKEHELLVKKYELEIALLQANLKDKHV